MISEKAVEMQRDIFLCFIDYQKVFDTVRHGELLRMLARLGMDKKDLRVIKNLYYQQKAAVRVRDELTETVDIKRGVRQGCVPSPDLFILFGEIMGMEGFSIGGRNVKKY